MVHGRQLVVYVLHAKSNLGDMDENRRLRKDYAALVNSLARQDEGSPLVVLGDFNSEPDAEGTVRLSESTLRICWSTCTASRSRLRGPVWTAGRSMMR